MTSAINRYVTPGKWRVDTERHAVVTNTPVTERGSEHDVVATCPGDRSAWRWEEGDATAIAALPDLVDYVRAARLVLDDYTGPTNGNVTEARRMLAAALALMGIEVKS